MRAVFGNWTTTKAAGAVVGALAIAGAVGSALAISPTIAPPINWQGGVEANKAIAGAELDKLYTVPAGRNFVLTDLVVSNNTQTPRTFSVFSQANGLCTIGIANLPRFGSMLVPPGDSKVLAFQTGIGFGAGQAVCVGTDGSLSFSARGFLFTPAPAS